MCLSTATLLLSLGGAADAAFIAHYDFTDGDLTDNEVGGSYTLNKVVNGADSLFITPQGAASFPGLDGGEKDYLETTGPGGAGSFTVSFWFKTDQVSQGNFQGLFSNNTVNSPNNFSWQVDVQSGTLRLVSATTGFTPITNAEGGEPQIQADVWQHVVVRKINDNGELFFGTEGSLTSVGSTALNPGGLQFFRLGVNRNTDSLYRMEMANVKIYTDAQISLDALNSEGPQLVPEPTSALIGLGLGGLLLARRRRG